VVGGGGWWVWLLLGVVLVVGGGWLGSGWFVGGSCHARETGWLISRSKLCGFLACRPARYTRGVKYKST